MRILGLDIGAKRIGIAVSDPLGITAQNRGFINRGTVRETIALLREEIARHDVQRIIVGLPLNMNGSEGESARLIRNFSRRIERQMQLPVILWDERLTTAEADTLMKSAGLSRKKRSRLLDGMAAQLILQSYLDSQR